MVLDSVVAFNRDSFSDNHAFYCLIVHDEYLTIDVQYLYDIDQIVLPHNYSSPGSELPEQRILAYKQNNQLPVV